jgi:uncharacterized protein (TIGR02646 family)
MASGYLGKKAARIAAMAPADRGQRIGSEWDKARQTKTVRCCIFGLLRRMAGNRQRCMYCEDSRGTDIDHFWPKSRYPQRAFDWMNMLLICTGCQRAKGDRFPLDSNDRPQLIDPTAEEPWDYLFFVPATGVITARYDPATGEVFAKGEATIDLLPLNDEAIADGRKRIWRDLQRAVQGFIDIAEGGFVRHFKSQAIRELVRAVHEDSERGLACWVFLRDGQEDDPFRRLRDGFPDVFRGVAESIAQ